jgi:TPR repeat protein
MTAQFNFGNLYSRGEEFEGVEKNLVQAEHWYRKAAVQGCARAQSHLGFMYSKGEGVMKDAVKAVHWWRKAAEQGLAEAQSNLGVMYENGEGVEKDAAQAAHWYRKAAVQGRPCSEAAFRCQFTASFITHSGSITMFAIGFLVVVIAVGIAGSDAW